MTSFVPAIPIRPAVRPADRPAAARTPVPRGPVQHPWGRAEALADGPGYRVERRVVLPGRMLPLCYRLRSGEHLTVVGGEVHLSIGGDIVVLEPDDSFYVPAGATHRLDNRGGATAVVIAVRYGSDGGDDDTVSVDDGREAG